MKRAQHAAHNSKFEKWDYSDIPGSGHKKIKGLAHMVEGGHHLRTAPNTHPQQIWVKLTGTKTQ